MSEDTQAHDDIIDAEVDELAQADTSDAHDEFDFEDEFVEESSLAQKLKKMRAELRDAKKQRDEYLAGWQKAKADYINLKNESEESRKSLREHIQYDNVLDLLPVIDSFEMAMAGEAWESVDANWRTGVEYIYQQLWKVLESYGVTEIAEIDIPLDPTIHEPMGTEPVGAERNDHVLAIVQKGYRMGERVVRAAKVTIGKEA